MDLQPLNDTEGFVSEVEERVKLPPYNCVTNCTVSGVDRINDKNIHGLSDGNASRGVGGCDATVCLRAE